MAEQLDLLADPSDDPNADLIGWRLETSAGELVVTATSSWDRNYVLVDVGGRPSCRAAALVRARMLRG